MCCKNVCFAQQKLPDGTEYVQKEGSKPENRSKNRFLNIRPCMSTYAKVLSFSLVQFLNPTVDKNRVVLDSEDSSPSDYINASYISVSWYWAFIQIQYYSVFIQGYNGIPQHYIATQGNVNSLLMNPTILKIYRPLEGITFYVTLRPRKLLYMPVLRSGLDFRK